MMSSTACLHGKRTEQCMANVLNNLFQLADDTSGESDDAGDGVFEDAGGDEKDGKGEDEEGR